MPRKKSYLKKMMNKFPAVCISIKASIKRSVTVVIVRASVCWIKNNLLKLISQSHQTVLLNFFIVVLKMKHAIPAALACVINLKE